METLGFIRQNARWLAAGSLLFFLSSFGQTFFISLFAGEIRAEFGLSHGSWGNIYALGTFSSAVVMVWAGSLTDRYRARSLGAAILVALGLACLFMAGNRTWWLMALVIFALRFAGQGMMGHIAVVAMSRWFVATRGRALAIATLGYSAGEALLPLLFVGVLGGFGWRTLWVFAAATCAMMVPVILGLLRSERTPQSMSEDNQSFGMQGRFWTRRDCLRHPLYWFMIPALLGPSAFGTALFFHQVHFAEIKGWQHLDFVALIPVYSVTTILAMIVSGWALDRWGTARLIPWFQVPLVVAFALFGLAGTPGTALLAFVFFAMTSGCNATLPNAFWAEFYGTRYLGSIKALATAVMVLGSAIGPGLTGTLIDAGIGFETQLLWVAGYFVFTTLMMNLGIRRFARDLTA